MRRIIHISDTHFGRTEASIIAELSAQVILLRPDLVIISGDLTQRARPQEFESARTLIAAFSASNIPVLAVPGNHDIPPLYAPYERLTRPYERFNTQIASLAPSTYVDAEVAVYGMNTVLRTRVSRGGLSLRDIEGAAEWYESVSEECVRIVVTHHPLDLPTSYSKRKLAVHARRGVYLLEKSRIDLYLSGHYHRSGVHQTTERYKDEHYTALVVHAGTVSTRARGELQSFNVLAIDRPHVTIDTYVWQLEAQSFAIAQTNQFAFAEGMWRRTDEAP